MSHATGIRRAHTSAACAHEAAAALYSQLRQEDMTLVLLFVSPEYDLDALATALTTFFGDTLLLGCTTAGEIGAAGYLQHSISGVSLAAPDFFASAQTITDLQGLTLADGLGIVMQARHRLTREARIPLERNTFALMLIDGLSRSEERIASTLSRALGSIPLLGGSAADNMQFCRTAILSDGCFVSDAAVLVLVATRHPFELFKSESNVAAGERVVITGADADSRIVTEINGEPAAAVYANMLGLAPELLSPLTFASQPLVMQVGGVPYVRAIQRIRDDMSMQFFCAIDEGIVLSPTRMRDIVGTLAHSFSGLEQRLGPLQLVLGCDCILRTISNGPCTQRAQLSALLSRYKVTGFNTYGEQFNAMHVNQTFTGIAIGQGSAA